MPVIISDLEMAAVSLVMAALLFNACMTNAALLHVAQGDITAQ